MPLFLTRKQREDSACSVDSYTSSFQIWYRKRKRSSLSPSRSLPLRQASPTSDASLSHSSRSSTGSKDQDVNGSRMSQKTQCFNKSRPPSPAQDREVTDQTQSNRQGSTTLPPGQDPAMGRPKEESGFIPKCKPGRACSRRSSSRLPEILPPQDFTVEELEEPLILSRPSCPIRVGRVSQPRPEPGWRVATRPRSPESCFLTTRPLYSARLHSPLVTGKPFIIYFEGEIRPCNSEDGVYLALGFVAGRNRASRMPGLERGSIGIHCRDGGLFVNGNLVATGMTAVFEPGQRVGLGIAFSMSVSNSENANSVQSLAASSSSIVVEVFLSRNRKQAGRWNLDELGQPAGLFFKGLEGSHDLYAAVGTSREVNADILFERRDWKFDPDDG